MSDSQNTFDEDEMLDSYGTRDDWESDQESPAFSDEYNAFLRNGCVGILTREQAIESYKIGSGRHPDTVEEWPEIDWVQSKREKLLEEIDPNTPKEEIEILLNQWYPFEPMLKTSY